MIDHHFLHLCLRNTHILAGSLGLICFWIPVFAKKGGRLHTLAGRVFVWLASVVAVSASIACAWALVAPIHFSGITRQLSDEDARAFSDRIYFLYGLLGLLTIWFASGLQLSLRALKTKKNQHQLGNLWTRTLSGIATLASMIALAHGAYKYVLTSEGSYFIFIVLGILGITDGVTKHRNFQRTNHGAMDWWYLHMQEMLGTGIAFHTAFFLAGGRRFWGETTGAWTLLLWIIPSAVGIPAILLWTNYYRKYFEQSKDASRPVQ